MVPVPQSLTTGAITTMSFAVPNERREPMSGVTIRVPPGFRIVRAHRLAGWAASWRVGGPSATWRGGPLAYLGLETFRLDIEVTSPPGQVRLDTLLLYPRGETVNWPAGLTIVPGRDDGQSPSVGWGLIAAIAGVGLVFLAGVWVLAWHRTTRT